MSLSLSSSEPRESLGRRPRRLDAQMGSGSAREVFESSRLSARLDVVDAYTAAWENGESPDLGAFLNRLDPADSEGRIELIYRDFCLAEAHGSAPDANAYRARFPEHSDSLGRLLELHAECPSSLLGQLVDPEQGEIEWPRAGDWIGSYHLKRELGRGAFGRVFLAEQVELENRLVVLKLTTRPSKEANLLARARHAHIVEVEAQEPVDDGAFQLIRMPFWGGATLAAVLEARRGRPRPVTGRELLDDLDSVGAPEYPAVQTKQPAHEILSRLSHEQAVAWLIARLAAALDHAFRKAVVHGDVKPSNIILAADGTPMLLDFNLAQDGSGVVPEGVSSERGGTLAYMAPERLDGLDRELRSREEKHSDPKRAAAAADLMDFDPHQADLYSLGMVLLEALTGRPPELGGTTEKPPARPRAADWARGRRIPATALIRQAERGGKPISRGLKSILERCLDPDPSRRYRQARELAEDLDRWRADRPLLFAAESFCRDAVPRFVRRQRHTLTAASITILVGSTAAILVARFVSLQALTNRAQEKMSWYARDLEGGAYGFQRPGARLSPDPIGSGLGRSTSANDRERRVVDIALRAFKDYDLLGSGDWRDRDDVRPLPEDDRVDLELWLLEQGYRYCRALAARVDSPADWERARTILDQVARGANLESFNALARALEAKLIDGGFPVTNRVPSPEGPAADPNLYLLGVAAEYEPIGPSLGNRDQQPRAALDLYEGYLSRHPRSYWGHYRAASASFALGRFEQAAEHLRKCLARWPDNAALHLGLSSCLAELGEFSDALSECDLAQAGAPDYPEIYGSRAFIRASSGNVDGLAEDIQRFEMLSGRLPSEYWRIGAGLFDPRAAGVSQQMSALPGLINTLAGTAPHGDPIASRRGTFDLEPEDIHFRGELATRILQSGERDLAAAEFTKILVLDPGDIPARINRACWEVESQRFPEAAQDFEVVFKHPGLVDHLGLNPNLINSLLVASHSYLRLGKLDESRDISRRSLNLAIAIKGNRGNCHFALARAYAATARSLPNYLARAAKQLRYSFQANESAYRRAYALDSAFDPVRGSLDALLRSKCEPLTEDRPRPPSPVAQTR